MPTIHPSDLIQQIIPYNLRYDRSFPFLNVFLTEIIQFFDLNINQWVLASLQVSNHDKHYDEQGVLTYHHRWLVLIDDFKNVDKIGTSVGNITNLSLIVKTDRTDVSRSRKSFTTSTLKLLHPCLDS